MYGISTQSESKEEGGEEAVIFLRAIPALPHGAAYSTFLENFITVAALWETMCTPNEDLRAVFLSCSQQMCQEKKIEPSDIWPEQIHILHPCGPNIKDLPTSVLDQ